MLFPVPWAREPSISHLETCDAMETLLDRAGFRILHIFDSTDESHGWFEEMLARMSASGQPAVTFQAFMGDDYPEMVRNQVRNLSDRRIRTVAYICEA